MYKAVDVKPTLPQHISRINQLSNKHFLFSFGKGITTK